MKGQYDFSKARRGAVIKVPRGKSRITIRLDADVLYWFRKQVDDAGGGSLSEPDQQGVASVRRRVAGAARSHRAPGGARRATTGRRRDRGPKARGLQGPVNA